MAQGVFTRLLNQARKEGRLPKKSKESIDWFRRRTGKVKDTKNRIMSDYSALRGQNSMIIGRMYFFKYDAKHKETLPYWDALPLIFPFNESSTHIWGINFHYLPPTYRTIMLDKLYDLTKGQGRLDQDTYLQNLSWQAIKAVARNKYYKPMVHSYIKKRVKSQFIEVRGNEWPIAIFLPLASWRKASAQKVYSDTRKMLGG